MLLPKERAKMRLVSKIFNQHVTNAEKEFPSIACILISLPIGVGQKAIDRWKRTNMLTVEIFNAFWKKVSPDLPMPGPKAGDEASYCEWTDTDGVKYQGMRNAAGLKSGIVREVSEYGRIVEATYFEDKSHGLTFKWYNNDFSAAFQAKIYVHGDLEAYIAWRDDWSEYGFENKELILGSNGLNIFKK